MLPISINRQTKLEDPFTQSNDIYKSPNKVGRPLTPSNCICKQTDEVGRPFKLTNEVGR